jgi:hypothetical protein
MIVSPEDYLAQPYVRAIAQAVADGRLPVVPGMVSELLIAHDDGCPALTGGLCCCDPELACRLVEGAPS